MFSFHSTCGSKIQFSTDGRTAERLSPTTDFNNGLVFSQTALETNAIFQVRVDKRVGLWSGSIEVGVTTVSPDQFTNLTIPQSAIELRNGTWLMSSKSVLHDGEILLENYGFDLEDLNEGDTVGLMRTSQGGLVFFINGTSQGVASTNIPADIYAVVNLYGKCAQVTLVDVEVSEQSTNTIEVPEEIPDSLVSVSNYNYNFNTENNSECEKLQFHSNCGPLVKLSSHNRTAERRRPMEEFNNAVVLTNRPLADDELFQVRIDMLVHKWSGSIEFGLTSQNPENFDFPATMTIMKNGTVIMSGNGILHDGKATNSPSICFNLDQLQEGDRIGVLKNKEGEVHYFINGADKGVATTGMTHPVWGAINLYGMAAKVTIVDRNEREEHNLRLNVRSLDYISPDNISASAQSQECILFHPNCGFHAAVINNGRTAHRPNARDDFNHGVVLTNRMLKPNEFFEVRLDKMVTKWAGSIEIGVTTHVPTQLDYPCTMTNVRSGTWMMTGNGIMHNGASIVDEYGQSLDRLKVGDRVGVLRKESGNLHFFVNGEDMGVAATNIPEGIFGVIDLYGQAAQASVISHSNNIDESIIEGADLHNDNSVSPINTVKVFSNGNYSGGDSYFETHSGQLRFNTLCGKNARISNNGFTASRPNSLGEFNAAIVTSSRALRDGELFEVVIERMVDRWSGNIEAGVTSIRPEDLVFPNTMTDIDHDTWMLSGSSIMTGGRTITNRYNCNLDSLTIGSRVGMMRKSDGTLHYVIDGQDQGIGAYDIPADVYAVIDLYGQCAQVSVTRFADISLISSQVLESLSQPIINDSSHRFNICCGKNIILKNNSLTATRVRHYAHGLIFSALPLELEELFEIRLTEVRCKWAGSLMLGVTTLFISDAYIISNIPHTISAIRCKTWYICGNQVRRNNIVLKENYGVNLSNLSSGDRIGLFLSAERNLSVFLNGEDMGVAVYDLPKEKFHVVVDLYGTTEAVTITSTIKNSGTNASVEPLVSQDNSLSEELSNSKSTANLLSGGSGDSPNGSLTFDGKHFGKNIELLNDSTEARRISGYNEGIVLVAQTLKRGLLYQVKIDTLNPRWTSSIMIGVVDTSFDRTNLPWSAFQLKCSSCIICADCVYQNGIKIKEKYGPNLDFLPEGHTVGILLDFQSQLHLYINGIDQGIAAKISSSKCRVLIDLYGQCEGITLLNSEESASEPRDLKNLRLMTEKISKLSLDEDVITICKYMSACIRFKNSLCLPEPYFVLSDPVLCYCSKCYKMRGDPPIHRQGDPLAEYAVPLGWVRFPVNITSEAFSNSPNSHNPAMTSSTSSLSNVLTTWHVAFFGLKIPHIREIMDAGQLFAAGDPAYGTFGSTYRPSKKQEGNKDEKADGTVISFSPSIEHATVPAFSPVYQYMDPMEKQKVSVRVALQILVQPGSYKVGPAAHLKPVASLSYRNEQFSGSSSPVLDPETIEWATKEQNSTHVCAVLVEMNGGSWT